MINPSLIQIIMTNQYFLIKDTKIKMSNYYASLITIVSQFLKPEDRKLNFHADLHM